MKNGVAAMAGCDAHNPMRDLFFSARLRRLIEAGAAVASGDRRQLSRYRVRAV